MDPKYIQANYTLSISFDLEDILKQHNEEWSNVKEWYVRWGTLTLVLTSGKVITDESTDMLDGSIDWKRPNDVQLF